MPDLRQQLQQLLQGRVCLMGLGNVAYGDDGFGVRLAEKVNAKLRRPKSKGRPKPAGRSESHACNAWELEAGSQVIVAGTNPERWIARAADGGFDHVVFLDAVEFGALPGSVVLLRSDEMAARFPQISTHKLSLGLLAKQVEANGRTKAWLLGVHPQSLTPSEELTSTVRATLHLLLDLLGACLGGRASSRAQTSLDSSRSQGSRGRSPSQAAEVMA